MILLENRAVIKISGEDAKSFLQGLITNDVEKAVGEQAVYSAMLTPQGKYLFDFFIYDSGDGSLLVDCEAARKDEFIKKLKMYKLRAKVEIEDLPDWKVYADDEQGVADPRLDGVLGKRLLTSDPQSEDGEFSEYETVRIENVIPDSTDFIPEKSFILQYRFEDLGGVDYQKGCYVGQEVTARTHYKGTIRKSLFKVESESLPAFGDAYEGGVMLNSVGSIGLALLPIKAD